jgi:hypothetical protein
MRSMKFVQRPGSFFSRRHSPGPHSEAPAVRSNKLIDTGVLSTGVARLLSAGHRQRYVAWRRQLSVTLAFRGGAFASRDAMSLS